MPRSPPNRAAQAEQLRLMAERALSTLDSIGDAVLSTDLSGNVTYVNAVAERMTGWSAVEAIGRPLPEMLRIIDAHSREPVRDPLAMAIRRDAIVGLGEDSLLVHRDGHEVGIEDTAAPIHDRNGQVTGAVIVFRDVGAARALSLRMTHLAQHDALTGLPNRLLLTDRLDRAIAATRRHGGSLAVLYLDLDHFKRINDSWGHGVGDRVLQTVAHRLGACVRGSDTVSRHGGDEFIVLLSELACPEDAASSADKLLAAIAMPQRIDNHDLQVTASAGVAIYPADGTLPETLLKHADSALLRAKGQRRPGPDVASADKTSRLLTRKSCAL